MSRYNPQERQIMDALRDYGDSQRVTALLNVPLDWVERLAEQMKLDADHNGPHSMATKLASPYSDYWRDWQAAHPEPLPPPKPKPEPRRQAVMTPDDRSEELDFDKVLAALASGINAGGAA